MMYNTTYLYPQSVIQMAFLEVDNSLWNLLKTEYRGCSRFMTYIKRYTSRTAGVYGRRVIG